MYRTSPTTFYHVHLVHRGAPGALHVHLVHCVSPRSVRLMYRGAPCTVHVFTEVRPSRRSITSGSDSTSVSTETTAVCREILPPRAYRGNRLFGITTIAPTSLSSIRGCGEWCRRVHTEMANDRPHIDQCGHTTHKNNNNNNGRSSSDDCVGEPPAAPQTQVPLVLTVNDLLLPILHPSLHSPTPLTC